MFDKEGKELTISAVGDAMLTRRWSVCEEPRFRELINILRSSDVSFANLEVLLHDYEGYPSPQVKGTYMRAPPHIANELLWAGFNIVSAATNHTGDLGTGGVERTIQVLKDHDLTFAGLGENLAKARAPNYLDTGAGRIGLIAACSTFVPGSEAGEQRRDYQGRPGLSPLRLETKVVVPDQEYIENLRELEEVTGLGDLKSYMQNVKSEEGHPRKDTKYTFYNPGIGYLGGTLKFEVGDSPGIYQSPNEDDLAAIIAQIRAAKRQSDWLIASLHIHEGENAKFSDPSVSPVLEKFAHDCIDAGADMVFGHGSHVLSGIEVYNGAPVLYGLGNFVVQNETIPYAPAEFYSQYDLSDDALPADLYDKRIINEDGKPKGGENYWQSLLAQCSFERGKISEIRLYPVDLCRNLPRPKRGRPVLASEEMGNKILTSLRHLSEPYGTDIVIEDGVGIVDV